MNARIPNPTLRKVRNRGFIPCRYQTDDGFYNGWIVRTKRTGAIVIHLVAEDRDRTIKGDDRRYVAAL